jgi:hypothetical protein
MIFSSILKFFNKLYLYIKNFSYYCYKFFFVIYYQLINDRAIFIYRCKYFYYNYPIVWSTVLILLYYRYLDIAIFIYFIELFLLSYIIVRFIYYCSIFIEYFIFNDYLLNSKDNSYFDFKLLLQIVYCKLELRILYVRYYLLNVRYFVLFNFLKYIYGWRKSKFFLFIVNIYYFLLFVYENVSFDYLRFCLYKDRLIIILSNLTFFRVLISFFLFIVGLLPLFVCIYLLFFFFKYSLKYLFIFIDFLFFNSYSHYWHEYVLDDYIYREYCNYKIYSSNEEVLLPSKIMWKNKYYINYNIVKRWVMNVFFIIPYYILLLVRYWESLSLYRYLNKRIRRKYWKYRWKLQIYVDNKTDYIIEEWIPNRIENYKWLVYYTRFYSRKSYYRTLRFKYRIKRYIRFFKKFIRWVFRRLWLFIRLFKYWKINIYIRKELRIICDKIELFFAKVWYYLGIFVKFFITKWFWLYFQIYVVLFMKSIMVSSRYLPSYFFVRPTYLTALYIYLILDFFLNVLALNFKVFIRFYKIAKVNIYFYISFFKFKILYLFLYHLKEGLYILFNIIERILYFIFGSRLYDSSFSRTVLLHCYLIKFRYIGFKRRSLLYWDLWTWFLYFFRNYDYSELYSKYLYIYIIQFKLYLFYKFIILIKLRCAYYAVENLRD